MYRGNKSTNELFAELSKPGRWRVIAMKQQMLLHDADMNDPSTDGRVTEEDFPYAEKSQAMFGFKVRRHEWNVAYKLYLAERWRAEREPEGAEVH